MLLALVLASGSMAFENHTSPADSEIDATNTGMIICKVLTPEALRAVNSLCSENLPNAIRLATNTAIGAAKTTMYARLVIISSKITPRGISLPISLSICNTKNCISSTNMTPKKQKRNGPKCFFSKSICRGFNFIDYGMCEKNKVKCSVSIT